MTEWPIIVNNMDGSRWQLNEDGSASHQSSYRETACRWRWNSKQQHLEWCWVELYSGAKFWYALGSSADELYMDLIRRKVES